MNQDDTSPKRIDPELEACVVAWVLGEVSPVEAEELSRLVAADPELAAFKRRIEEVHGLIGEVERPLREPERLSPGRREKLLAALSEGDAPAPASPLSYPAVRRPGWRTWIAPLSAAAALLLVAGLEFQWRLEQAAKARPSAVIAGNMPAAKMAARNAAIREENVASDEALLDAASIRRAHKKSEENTGRSPAVEGALSFDRRLADNRKAAALSVNSVDDITIMPPAAPMMEMPKMLPDGLEPRATELPAQALPNQAKAFAAASQPQTMGGLELAGKSPQVALSNQAVTLEPFEVQAASGSSFGQQSDITNQTLGLGGNITLQATGAITNQTEGGQPQQSQSGVPQTAATLGNIAAGTGQMPGSPTSLLQTQGAGAPQNFGGLQVRTAGGSGGNLAGSGDILGLGSAVAPSRSAPFTTAGGSGALTYAGNNFGAINDSGAIGVPSGGASASEVAAASQQVSTFSLAVGDASFRIARAMLASGRMPDPSSIRPEEFYNAFDYGDPSPVAGEPVACRIEQSAHPYLQERNLVRIAIKVPSTGRGAGQPLRLTVLLDTSGSMEREDRAASVRKAMASLASLLGPADRVTLIGFAREPHLLADRVPGDQASRLVDIVARTPADGGTNLEEALHLAEARAKAQFLPGAQNRIVVLTDGAANLGSDDPAQLSASVTTLRQQGISFDACGIGVDGLNDTVLEALTRKGEGRYYVINSPEEADGAFARQLAGAFRPAAQDVKVQVRFNPARVRSYRLIGFDQRRLRAEDFRNDRVAAADLAADEDAVALYQVDALPDGEGELGDVSVRFRQTDSGKIVERTWTLFYEPHAPAFDRASPSLQLAGIAALLAEKLEGGPLAAEIRLGEFAPLVDALPGHYPHEARVGDLATMFRQAARREGDQR